MQMIRNAEKLARVHTCASKLVTEKNKLNKATQINLKNANFDRFICVAFWRFFK